MWQNANWQFLGFPDSISPTSWISLFGTFLILFNTLIPISLYVTLEFVKLVQAKLIGVAAACPCARDARALPRARMRR